MKKKIYMATAVLAAVLLSGCAKDNRSAALRRAGSGRPRQYCCEGCI